MISGNGAAGRGSARNVRIDRRRGAGPEVLGPSRSGRWFVVGALIGLLIVVGSLALAFRIWRAAYQRRAAFGAGQVAPAILPLVDAVPPGVDEDDWTHAVERTRDLIVAVTGSNLMDQEQMTALRAELAGRAGRARPADAAAELVRIWDQMEDRAGPIVTQSSRFGLASAIRPLAHKVPPDVAPGDWAWAIAATRALLVDLADSRKLPPTAVPNFRAAWTSRAAVARPESAAKALGGVWDDVQTRARTVVEGRTRPPALP